MLAERSAVVSFYFAFFCGNVVHQKLSEFAFADETYSRAVLLFGGGKPVFLGDFSHLGFREIRKREKHVCKLALRKLIQKVGLVLVLIFGF